MHINTLKDIPELQGKKVLLRVDFNVPLTKEGTVQDDTRITEAMPTIEHIRAQGGKIILITHLGRPEGQVVEGLRLNPIAEHLRKGMELPLKKSDDITGHEAKKLIKEMGNGEIVMLENVRFHKGEESCDPQFTAELAALGDIFVNDAFGTAHRRHASTAGLGEYMPAYGGLLMEKEIIHLAPLTEGTMKKPLALIIGGSKIDTKIGILRQFLKKADMFLIGGGLANTFLAAAGHNIGESLYEEDKLETAREIMMACEKEHERIVLPFDAVVAESLDENVESVNLPIEDITDGMKIYDIGKWSAERFCNQISTAQTIIWNGPVGVFEHEKFRESSCAIAHALKNHKGTTIIGGGDTIDCIKRCGIPLAAFTHVSTGGGASIEFLAGEKLPGIEVLRKK